jgi:cysteinyl-tRNA synthetase
LLYVQYTVLESGLVGYRLEDKENEATVIKLVDRAELMREREDKLAAEEKRRLQKEAKEALRAERAAQAVAAAAQAKIPPAELFLAETDKYSKWDEKGMPTHTKEGEEVSKAQLKKLQKLYQAQEKRYKEYLQSQQKEP